MATKTAGAKTPSTKTPAARKTAPRKPRPVARKTTAAPEAELVAAKASRVRRPALPLPLPTVPSPAKVVKTVAKVIEDSPVGKAGAVTSAVLRSRRTAQLSRRVRNKHVVVTGASSGIGLDCAGLLVHVAREVVITVD